MPIIPSGPCDTASLAAIKCLALELERGVCAGGFPELMILLISGRITLKLQKLPNVDHINFHAAGLNYLGSFVEVVVLVFPENTIATAEL